MGVAWSTSFSIHKDFFISRLFLGVMDRVQRMSVGEGGRSPIKLEELYVYTWRSWRARTCSMSRVRTWIQERAEKRKPIVKAAPCTEHICNRWCTYQSLVNHMLPIKPESFFPHKGYVCSWCFFVAGPFSLLIWRFQSVGGSPATIFSIFLLLELSRFPFLQNFQRHGMKHDKNS